MNLEEIARKPVELRESVKERYKAQIVGTFGSCVRGEEKEGSDLDVLVKFEGGATLLELVGFALFLEKELGIAVDVAPYDALREEIRDRVLKEAVYL